MALAVLAAGGVATAQPIRAVAFRDGHVVAASDETIEVWEIGTKRAIRSTDIDLTLSRVELQLSPDGRLLAAHRFLTLPFVREADRRTMHDTRLIDVDSGQETALPFATAGAPAGLAFSADGSLLIRLTRQDAAVRYDIWRVHTSQRIGHGAVEVGDATPTAVAVSTAGDRFAIVSRRAGTTPGGADLRLLICDSHTGVVVQTIDTTATGVLFSPEGRALHFPEAGPLFPLLSYSRVAGIVGSREIRVWDARSGALVTSVEVTDARSIAASADGRFIVAGTPHGFYVFGISALSGPEWVLVLNSALQPGRAIPAGRFGAGAYYPGGPISRPVPIRQRQPKYPSEAMRAKIQGVVVLEMIVNADGTPGPIRIVRSLDRTYGLDDEAIAAARAWRFRPARNAAGHPVPVLVQIQFEFRISESGSWRSSDSGWRLPAAGGFAAAEER